MKTKHYLPILFVGMLFLFAVIMLCATPLQTKVEAAETSGTCGDNLTWTFDEATGTLSIEGTGDMWDYKWLSTSSTGSTHPWAEIASNIKIIRFDDGVTSIGDLAFRGCSNLTDIIIPQGITSIGNEAFNKCISLINITIPEGVTSIGDSAFLGCSNLTNIIIPEGVTSIAYNAFCNCSSLTSVTIPASVASISNHAFRDCSSLTNVTIPANVTSIGSHAFYGCSSLTDITIPEGMASISDYAFSGCSGLTNITIPDKVTNIGAYAFNECSSLTDITIPASVTNIGGGAFRDCSNLTNVTIPESVTSIGSYTFYGCSGLTNITIPDKVTSIGSYAFYGCSGLPNIIIPKQVTSIDSYAFNGCSGLTNIIIPESVTSIASYTFNGCSGLTDITIPESVTSIGSYAFCDCSSLKNIILPQNITSIGDATFKNCDSLTGITIPQGVTNIGDNAFRSCDNLTNIIIPASVTSIGESAFRYCGNLTNITIPKSVTNIDAYTFEGSGLKNITIPASVTSIGVDAFWGCSSLAWITFEGDAPTIASNSFYNVHAGVGYFPEKSTWDESTKVSYGGRLTWYPYGENGITASGTCGDSLNWSFEKDTLYISGTGAMYDWTYSPWEGLRAFIKYVELPIEVTRIGKNAFANCINLETIELSAGIEIGTYAFTNCDSLKIIKIPKKAIVESYAFYGCGALSYVSIASSATSFSKCCFYECPLLTSAGPVGGGYNIEFAWVEEIPAYAFASSKLSSVTVPASVTSIGGRAFEACSNLSVTFESNAPSFASDTFYRATDATVYYPYGYSGWEDVINQDYGGTDIKWQIYGYGSPTSLKLTSNPDLVSYKTGDALDLTGLQAVLVHDSGYEMPLAVEELTVGEVDFSTSGKKTVTVQYEGFSTTFEIVVYDTREVTVDASLYPESEHDYAASLNETKTFTYEGAFALTLTFSADTWTEANIDYIYLYDGDGNEIAKYTGSQAAGKTVQIPGDTFQIRLDSDESDGGYGYAFDSIVASVVVQDEVRFAGASIVLQDDLAVNFKVDKALFEEKGYTNPYVIFEFNGKQTVVWDYTVDGNRYVFSFRDVAPNQMNDTISATLYASYDGTEYASETRTYSVAEYCYSMLELYSDDAYAELRTLLVDLLHYGAKSQIYTNYKTDTLVDAQLTEAQVLWGTSGDPVLGTVLNTTYQTVENPTATWKGAGLHLQESVSVRLKFTADSIENLTVKIESGTETWTIASDKFIEEEGAYYVYFSGLDAGQMRQTLYLTLCNGDTPVSNTACYSIESYAYEKQNSTIDGLAELVKAMMRYGDSAYAYVN